MTIAVIDYGAGNVGSVIRMVERAGGTAYRVRTREELLAADKLILPGVGAFDHGMSQLASSELLQALHTAARERKVPVLGICLGMQLLCKSSEEGQLPGLGWINAEVVKFPSTQESGLRVPHMGWNTLKMLRSNALLPATEVERRFYFVHSFRVRCDDERDIIATAQYGVEFVAAFQYQNIYGVQFHPEKSHRFGMELIRNFIEVARA